MRQATTDAVYATGATSASATRSAASHRALRSARASASWPAICARCSRPARWCGPRAAPSGWRRRCSCTASSWCSCSRRCTKRSTGPRSAAGWLNDAVALGRAARSLMLPPAYFRAFHFAHHRHTQDPARDPELAAPKPRIACRLPVARLAACPTGASDSSRPCAMRALGVDEPFIARTAAAQPSCARRGCCSACICWRAARLDRCCRAAALLLPVGRPGAARPAVSAPVPAGRAHRLPAGGEHAARTRGPPAALAPIRRLAWNMPYHAEHHAYPALPFHALPAAHRLLQARIAVQARGYVAVHRADSGGPAPGRRRARSGDAQPERPAQLTHNERRRVEFQGSNRMRARPRAAAWRAGQAHAESVGLTQPGGTRYENLST